MEQRRDGSGALKREGYEGGDGGWRREDGGSKEEERRMEVGAGGGVLLRKSTGQHKGDIVHIVQGVNA